MFTLWLLISKTAVLETKYSNKYWKRAVGTYFLRLPLGEISLHSLNSPRDFWFPKRPCSSSGSFPERGRNPWAPPKGSETGLKPFWNTFRLTISDSLLLRLQHHCFILLFISRKDVFFLYVWAPPKGLKPVWNCRSVLTISDSMPLRVQRHCFGIAGEMSKLCDLVYCTTSKHLPAHHLRLRNLFLPNWFQVNFLMPVFLWNHAH